LLPTIVSPGFKVESSAFPSGRLEPPTTGHALLHVHPGELDTGLEGPAVEFPL
jgi:hypothetical protein